MHWLTDVLGGYALGGLWLFSYLTVLHMVERVGRQRAVQRSAPETSSPERNADTIRR